MTICLEHKHPTILLRHFLRFSQLPVSVSMIDFNLNKAGAIKHFLQTYHLGFAQVLLLGSFNTETITNNLNLIGGGGTFILKVKYKANIAEYA